MPEVPDNVDVVLDGLSLPTTDEVETATVMFLARDLAASAARRAMATGGGSLLVINVDDLQLSTGRSVIFIESNGTVTISINDDNDVEVNALIVGTDGIRAPYLPTSNPGPGLLWNDGNTVKVGT